jgi:hypothetical protein
MSAITTLRAEFQQNVCLQSIFLRQANIPSLADSGSLLSRRLAQSMLDRLGYSVSPLPIDSRTAGANFELSIRNFLEASLTSLSHLRPAEWRYTVHGNIANFVQYQHLTELSALIKSSREARTAFGDYVVKPDVVIARMPYTDDLINQNQAGVVAGDIPKLTLLRAVNHKRAVLPFLHASISCKLTIRSDRSQNARTEGLNLIRNHKGHTPHVAVVTAEPMPTRIAPIALGTGDIDCVYHFCLYELLEVVRATQNEALIDSLEIMVDGNRLRDVADLPFDLMT